VLRNSFIVAWAGGGLLVRTKDFFLPPNSKGTHVKKFCRFGFLAGLLLGLGCMAGSVRAADLFSYNFEAAGAAGNTQIPTPPWQMGSEVFTSSGFYISGYYPGNTFGPNAIVDGESGASQGTYVGKIWPDYDYAPNWQNDQFQSTLLYVNRVLGASDITGSRIEMTFDAKLQDTIGAASSSYGFVKLFSSDFSQLWAEQTVSITGNTWTTRIVGMDITANDPGLIGANLQWGVAASAQNYSANGLFVDNFSVATVPEPSSFVLMGLGAAGLVASRSRRRA